MIIVKNIVKCYMIVKETVIQRIIKLQIIKHIQFTARPFTIKKKIVIAKSPNKIYVFKSEKISIIA